MSKSGAARIAKIGLAAFGVASLGALAWGTLVERNRFTIRREVLPMLEPAATPLRVLHLSDIHMAPWQRAKQEWIRGLVAEEPDLIVITGDSLGHERGLEGLEYALRPFEGIPGVFVHGSNDYFSPVLKNPLGYFALQQGQSLDPPRLDIDSLEQFFENQGWIDLNNAATAMTIRGSRLEFVGVNDAHHDWDRLDQLPGALDDLRENEGWQDEKSGPQPITIALTHAPYLRVLNSFVNHGADVIFAGHTHGGQVRVPGVGALVTNCDLPRSMANGVHVWHHSFKAAYLEVSAGIGTSVYAPVRFACPPEAVMVTLTGDDFSYS